MNELNALKRDRSGAPLKIRRVTILDQDGNSAGTFRTVYPDKEYSDMEIHANGLLNGRNLPFEPSIRPIPRPSTSKVGSSEEDLEHSIQTIGLGRMACKGHATGLSSAPLRSGPADPPAAALPIPFANL